MSLVKSRDPKIYDQQSCKFFDQLNKNLEEDSDTDDENNHKNKNKKQDKKTLKDLEREMILKK